MPARSAALAGQPKVEPPRISYEQFLADHAGRHAEWVDGEVVGMSPVSTQHARVCQFLHSLLTRFVERNGCGEVFAEPFSMKTAADLPGRSPDLLYVANENAERIQPSHLDGPADLVVEVVSPDSRMRDRGEKYYEYEKGGVREYWLIDPARAAAEFYLLGDNGLYAVAPLDPSGFYCSRVLNGLRIKPSWMWQDPLPPVPSLLEEAGIMTPTDRCRANASQD